MQTGIKLKCGQLIRLFVSGFITIILFLGCEGFGFQSGPPQRHSSNKPNQFASERNSSNQNSGDIDIQEGETGRPSRTPAKREHDESGADDELALKLPDSTLEWDGKTIIDTPQFQLQPIDRTFEE